MKLYVDDVFSTYLYTGNGTTQTINNGINLSGNGGMVWIKSRTSAPANNHVIWSSSVLGYDNQNFGAYISTDATWGAQKYYNSNGPSVSSQGIIVPSWNSYSGHTYTSWTFRKAPKFFDVVTWTGNSINSRIINHTLGIAPGMIIVKRTDATADWMVYHIGRSG